MSDEMTMVERVARAICLEQDSSHKGLDGDPMCRWCAVQYRGERRICASEYRDTARAAIAALKNPTPDINRAICVEHHGADRVLLRLGYERGLDAVLAEPFTISSDEYY